MFALPKCLTWWHKRLLAAGSRPAQHRLTRREYNGEQLTFAVANSLVIAGTFFLNRQAEVNLAVERDRPRPRSPRVAQLGDHLRSDQLLVASVRAQPAATKRHTDIPTSRSFVQRVCTRVPSRVCAPRRAGQLAATGDRERAVQYAFAEISKHVLGRRRRATERVLNTVALAAIERRRSAIRAKG